jgi:hypothetical protein
LPDQVKYLWDAPEAPRAFLTAISLHSHTQYSRESLYFIPALAEKNPLLHWGLNLQKRRCKGVKADFESAYWTPPLTAQAAYQLERSQIEDELHLAGIVSLTDHDSIEAPLLLRDSGYEVPISIEWTVPFRETELHIGVHNLPRGRAQEMVAEMHAYTADPREELLRELLAALDEFPEVLVVLNHPLCDFSGPGPVHARALDEFLRKCNAFLHAFEVNALRPHAENQAVIPLARAWNQPLISGGDRHGCEPNAAVNLTRAGSMAEFVHEMRDDGHFQVLFLPRYRESLKLRMLQTVIDVVHEYPSHPLGRSWDNRVFHPDSTGAMRPLSALWDKSPQFIEAVLAILRLVEENAVRRNVRLTRNRTQVSEHLAFHPGGEAA